MKKLILILIPLTLVTLLTAITFEFDGVNRTRAAMYNDWFESTDGHIDNRLDLGMNTELAPNLNMRTLLRFGDVIWGNGGTGGGVISNVNISAYELYLDYHMSCIDANVRFGQQYWADPMGLIIDDSFSGVMLTKEFPCGMKTELGFIKALEFDDFGDDDNYFLLNMSTSGKLPWGLLASVYQMGSSNDDSYTIMPYVDLDMDPVQVKAAAFLGAHFYSPGDDEMGFGAAIKAKADMGAFNVGADILFATENGIATLSPYYMNGLYIYGYGLYNDSVNRYWSTPYSYNNDASFSAVGSFGMPILKRCNLFGAAGFVSDEGFEVNAGIEHDIIPEKMKIAAFGAFGFHDSPKINNYVFGTTVIVPF